MGYPCSLKSESLALSSVGPLDAARTQRRSCRASGSRGGCSQPGIGRWCGGHPIRSLRPRPCVRISRGLFCKASRSDDHRLYIRLFCSWCLPSVVNGLCAGYDVRLASESSRRGALAEKRKWLSGRLRVACAVSVEPHVHTIRRQDGRYQASDVESGEKDRQL